MALFQNVTCEKSTSDLGPWAWAICLLFGQELFAHTSAVYVTVAGRSVFDPRVPRELLAKMKAGRDVVREQGRFEDDLSKARVLDVYDDGIAALEHRLDTEGR